jgi:F-type H+-transporting ATPase subunit delta
MTSTKAARREAKQLFRSCLVNGLLDEDRVRGSIEQVLATKPRGYLAILGHFQRLVKLDLDRRSARVESAAPLDAPQEAAIRAGLERHHGPGLRISFAQNPALLGGVRIQVGSNVYDGTLRTRLDELKQAFESA